MILAEQIAEAQYLVGKGLIQHNGVPPADARTYLNGRLSPHLEQKYFVDGVFVAPKSDLDVYSLSDEQIIPALLRESHDIYTLGHESLMQGHNNRFNLHRLTHVATVARSAADVLALSGYDQMTQADAKIAGVLHDIGILNSRPFHHLTGAAWVDHAFPHLQGDPIRYEIIRNAIIQHNEAFYRTPKFEYMPFAEQVKIIKEIHSPVSSAVLIGDKADVSRQRVPGHARNQEELFTNYAHYSSNWYAKKGYVGPVAGGRAFMMELQLNPNLTKGEALKHPDLVGYRVDSPEEIYRCLAPDYLRVDPNDEKSSISAEKTFGVLMNLYGPQQPRDVNRIALTAASAWNLCPDMEAFILRLDDPQNPENSIEHAITLDNADEVFAGFAAQYGGHSH